VTEAFTREYSQRLGTLTGAQLQAALDRFDLGELADARPAPGGLFGQSVLLTAASGGWVLRGCPHYDGQFEKERFFSRMIHKRSGADAPWPFHIERSTDIFGWHFAIMRLLPGISALDPAVRPGLSDSDKTQIAGALGEQLARIQLATWDAPGEYDYGADEIAPLAAPYASWFIGNVAQRRDTCIKEAGSLTDDDTSWLDSLIEAARPALEVPFAPVIVHTDYAEGNAVVERTDGGYRGTGVFDLGGAYIGDGEYDLARLGCWYGRQSEQRLRAFVDAYAPPGGLRAGARERMAFYIAADRLIFWEYGKRNKVWFTDPHQTFRMFAEPFVDVAAMMTAQ
jgi:aminoglycoside phosphotransferase (APT) family kinase protein